MFRYRKVIKALRSSVERNEGLIHELNKEVTHLKFVLNNKPIFKLKDEVTIKDRPVNEKFIITHAGETKYIDSIYLYKHYVYNIMSIEKDDISFINIAEEDLVLTKLTTI